MPYALEGQKILMVDDAPTNITILGEVFRGECEVLAATSGEAALDVITLGKAGPFGHAGEDERLKAVARAIWPKLFATRCAGWASLTPISARPGW